MTHHFPIEFTLESGTHVTVTQSEGNKYEFNLSSAHSASRQFMYVNDGRSKAEIEEGLDFDELNALRTFWLKTDLVV